jgi:hypothetical protein
MLPLLHLEVAEGYRRLGSACGALEYLAGARAALGSLPERDRAAPAREIARLDARLGGRVPDQVGPSWQRRAYAGQEFWEDDEGDDPLH